MKEKIPQHQNSSKMQSDYEIKECR